MPKALILLLCTSLLSGCALLSVGPASKHGTALNAPYPYKSMLAICSDIDGTTIREFETYHKFLNTDKDSYFGKGLGLDIADSFWMFAVNDNGAKHDYNGDGNEAVMSYFMDDTDSVKYAEKIKRYYECGWIDSIHSFGDFSRVDVSKPVFTKELAVLANNEMDKQSLLPSVWINHGNEANVQNIKGWFDNSNLDYQQGGNPDSPYYHADMTIASGVKFIWFSEPSAEFACDSPLFPVTLQDGQKVWGFHRYTGEKPLLGAHQYRWSVYDLDKQLSEKNLDDLIAKRKVAVVSQHLGTSNGDYIFPGVTREAFTRLKQYEDRGEILVARTSRLLEFVRIRDNLNYTYENGENGEVINIISIDDPVLGRTEANDVNMLKGLSFYVNNAANAGIHLNGVPVDDSLLLKSAAGEAEQVIAFKWYDKDLTDYTEEVK